jgi:hypothetical protein
MAALWRAKSYYEGLQAAISDLRTEESGALGPRRLVFASAELVLKRGAGQA